VAAEGCRGRSVVVNVSAVMIKLPKTKKASPVVHRRGLKDFISAGLPNRCECFVGTYPDHYTHYRGALKKKCVQDNGSHLSSPVNFETVCNFVE
jgi:hypothetical protein